MRAITPILLGLVLPVPSPQAAFPQDSPAAEPQKSAKVGIAIAVANTLVPAVLALQPFSGDDDMTWLLIGTAYSWVVGPFPGLAYAGNTKRGLKGMGVRLVSLFVFHGMLATTWKWNNFGPESGPTPMIVLPLAAGVISSIWDMAAIPSAVREYNERLAVSPTLGANGRVGARLEFRW